MSAGVHGAAPEATGRCAGRCAEGGEREKNLQEARDMLGLLGTTTKALQDAWSKPLPQ